MPVKVLYSDLRTAPLRLERAIVEWFPGMRAAVVVQQALPQEIAERVIVDLGRNDLEITVSWSHDATDQRSEVGGVGSLDWKILDRTVLVITYEYATTGQEVIDAAIAWMLEDDGRWTS